MWRIRWRGTGDCLFSLKLLGLFQTLLSHMILAMIFTPSTISSIPWYSSLHVFGEKPVQNSDKLMEQAKNFLDSSSEPPNTQMVNDTVSEGNHDFDVKEVVESPRGRRPGLGRKRARFSLLSNSNQPTVNFEPTLDIDKLKDPEEFFLAFERLENAKREIAKQIGCVSIDSNDSNQCSTSMFPRTRRPGILGRSRMVKYKHLYPIMSSQGTFQENMLSPSNCSTQQETVCPECSSQETEPANAALQQGEPANVASEEMEGSIAKAEDGVDKLLDDLLAHNYEALDGDGALTLLQDRLQVKPLDIDKLNLPELQDIQKIDLNALGRNLPKCKNVLPDVQNFLKGARRINPLKQKEADSSIPCFGSPTPKSPLASLSLLKKHILLSNPSSDPFSAADIDQSLASNTFKDIEKFSDPVDLEKESISLKLSSLTVEKDDRAVCNMSSAKVAIGNSNNTSDKSVNDNLNGLGSGGDAGASEFLADSGANNVGMGNGNFTCLDDNEGFGTTGRDKSEGMAEDVVQEAATSAQPYLNMDQLSKEMSNNNQNQFDQSSSAVVEGHAIDGFSKTGDTAPKQTQDAASEHHNNQEPTVVTINEESKAKSRLLKERKNSRSLCRRQSLAASGTSWETGVRRSTRIRSRPLEYWKGERFLYGRIHGSLATIIGIKYESPRKDNGKPTIKVKSFVPDKYKDLIKLAALH